MSVTNWLLFRQFAGHICFNTHFQKLDNFGGKS